jgi:hypothetical protein
MNKSQTNGLLGYPDDARLLIINADDFGMCHSVNEAVCCANCQPASLSGQCIPAWKMQSYSPLKATAGISARGISTFWCRKGHGIS